MESKAYSIISPSSHPCKNIVNPPASTLLPAAVPPPKRRSKHCVRIQFNLLEAEQERALGASRKKRACILVNLIPHSEEEWLLSGLESSTKVDDGEEEEEKERQENKKNNDREESEETGEMSPSKWSKVMSEMCNKLTGVMKSYMVERKSSTTEPENEAKDMTNMGQTEEGRGSSTSPAPMDVDELNKVVEMARNVATLNKEEDKEEYKVIAMNEEDPEATNSIKHGQKLPFQLI
ncbi:hypothetical protein Taro_047775 [Colocasia esculenta]|uniref:Uncharacterized protein n=1 Tax=Colocasia esculenta TaxID=4460 RepID=A0A843WWW4_COLES|nr:hypothetical protein [Colocasia esculenta]